MPARMRRGAGPTGVGRAVLCKGRLELGERLVRRPGADAVVLVDDNQLTLLALGVDPLGLWSGTRAKF